MACMTLYGVVGEQEVVIWVGRNVECVHARRQASEQLYGAMVLLSNRVIIKQSWSAFTRLYLFYISTKDMSENLFWILDDMRLWWIRIVNSSCRMVLVPSTLTLVMSTVFVVISLGVPKQFMWICGLFDEFVDGGNH